MGRAETRGGSRTEGVERRPPRRRRVECVAECAACMAELASSVDHMSTIPNSGQLGRRRRCCCGRVLRAPAADRINNLLPPCVTQSSTNTKLPPDDITNLPRPHCPRRPCSLTPPGLLRVLFARQLLGGGKPRRAKAYDADDDVDFKSSATSRAGRERATRSRRGSGTPTASLESVADEFNDVAAEVARIGLILRNVPGDGNCLFRCISDQLWGNGNRHLEVRRAVCDYLSKVDSDEHPFYFFFKHSIEFDETPTAYINRMRKSGTYASALEVQVVCQVYHRSVRVIQRTATGQFDYTPAFEPEAEEAPKETAPSSAPAATPRRRRHLSSQVKVDIPPIKIDHDYLWIAHFAQAEHYQSVRVGGRAGPAEVPNSYAVPHHADKSEAARTDREACIGTRRTKPRAGVALEKYSRDGRLAEVRAAMPSFSADKVTDEEIAAAILKADGDVSKAIDAVWDEFWNDESASTGSEAGDKSSESSTSTTSEAHANIVESMLETVPVPSPPSTRATSPLSTLSSLHPTPARQLRHHHEKPYSRSSSGSPLSSRASTPASERASTPATDVVSDEDEQKPSSSPAVSPKSLHPSPVRVMRQHAAKPYSRSSTPSSRASTPADDQPSRVPRPAPLSAPKLRLTLASSNSSSAPSTPQRSADDLAGLTSKRASQRDARTPTASSDRVLRSDRRRTRSSRRPAHVHAAA